jgi:hypothetical protein
MRSTTRLATADPGYTETAKHAHKTASGSLAVRRRIMRLVLLSCSGPVKANLGLRDFRRKNNRTPDPGRLPRGPEIHFFQDDIPKLSPKMRIEQLGKTWQEKTGTW